MKFNYNLKKIMLELLKMLSLKELIVYSVTFAIIVTIQITFYSIATAQQRKQGFVVYLPIYRTGALIACLSCLLLINEYLFSLNVLSINNSIINDYLGFVAKVFVCLTSVLFLVLITSSYEDKTVQSNFEYTMFIFISVVGILLLYSSNDLMTTYLSIELQSIAFYTMAVFKKNSVYSIGSGLKYFVVGSLSSAFLLFGLTFLYECSESLGFQYSVSHCHPSELTYKSIFVDYSNDSSRLAKLKQYITSIAQVDNRLILAKSFSKPDLSAMELVRIRLSQLELLSYNLRTRDGFSEKELIELDQLYSDLCQLYVQEFRKPVPAPAEGRSSAFPELLNGLLNSYLRAIYVTNWHWRL